MNISDEQLNKIAGQSWDATIDGAAEWAEQDEYTIRIHTEATRATLEAATPIIVATDREVIAAAVDRLADAMDEVLQEGGLDDDDELSARAQRNSWRTAVRIIRRGGTYLPGGIL